jgi:hypothetical protein
MTKTTKQADPVDEEFETPPPAPASEPEPEPVVVPQWPASGGG